MKSLVSMFFGFCLVLVLIMCKGDSLTAMDDTVWERAPRFLEGDVFCLDEAGGFVVGNGIRENSLDVLEDVTLGSRIDGKCVSSGILLSNTEELVRYIVEAVYRIRRGGKGSCLLKDSDGLDGDALDVVLAMNFGRKEAYDHVSRESLGWREGLSARVHLAVVECPVGSEVLGKGCLCGVVY